MPRASHQEPANRFALFSILAVLKKNFYASLNYSFFEEHLVLVSQHMDVSLNKELKTYPTEVALNHELPLDLVRCGVHFCISREKRRIVWVIQGISCLLSCDDSPTFATLKKYEAETSLISGRREQEIYGYRY